MFTSQDFLAAQQASAETLFDATGKVFVGVEAVIELNLKTAREGLAEAADLASSAFSVNDAQELLPLQTGALQPAAQKAADYGRQLFEIASSTNAELTAIAEKAAARLQQQMMSMVDVQAPSADNPASAFIQQAVAAANDAYATMQRAALKAVQVDAEEVDEPAPKAAPRKTKRTA